MRRRRRSTACLWAGSPSASRRRPPDDYEPTGRDLSTRDRGDASHQALGAQRRHAEACRPRSIAATSSTSSIRSRAGESTSSSARTAPSDAASSLVDLRVSAGQRWPRRRRHGAGRDALPRSGLDLLRRPVRRRVGRWSNRGWRGRSTPGRARRCPSLRAERTASRVSAPRCWHHLESQRRSRRDQRPWYTSGLRLGSPAVTTLGMGRDVDAWHSELSSAGLPVTTLSDQPWGMREFRLTDPSGNHVRIGRSV